LTTLTEGEFFFPTLVNHQFICQPPILHVYSSIYNNISELPESFHLSSSYGTSYC